MEALKNKRGFVCDRDGVIYHGSRLLAGSKGLVDWLKAADKVVDLKAGRINGVLGWMVVDIALSTGLRVSEIGKLHVEEIDLKRGSLAGYRKQEA